VIIELARLARKVVRESTGGEVDRNSHASRLRLRPAASSPINVILDVTPRASWFYAVAWQPAV